MSKTTSGNRLHVALFGRKNIGKSTLLNALAGANASAVADSPGTTQDSLFYPMELDPVGPVVLIDTAGFEDNEHSELGEIRGRKLLEVMDQTDLALLMFMDTNEDYTLEKRWYKELTNRHIPVLGIINRIDDRYVDAEPIRVQFDEIPLVKISASNRVNINRVRQTIRRTAPLEFERGTIVGDLVKPRDLVLLVTEDELKAPRFRLPTIHSQIIRDILDQGAASISVTESELQSTLSYLKKTPELIITVPELLEAVCAAAPPSATVTTFSLLLARHKGNLQLLIDGAKAVDALRPGDRVLIAEACKGHETQGETSRSLLPEQLHEKAGGTLLIDVVSGLDFPADLTPYKMVLHCNACAFSRKQLMARMAKSEAQRVPFTNYGLVSAYLKGLLERTCPEVVY